MGRSVRWLVALSLVASWFLVSPSQAGSSAEPEITDASGDGATHRDIVKVWFEPGVDEFEGNVSITMALAAAPAGGQTTLFALHERWNIWFVPTAGLPAGMNAAYVSFTIGVGTTSNTGNYGISGRLGFTPTIGTYGQLTTEIALAPAPKLAGTTVTAMVPLALLKGFTPGVDAFTKMYANVVLTARGPTSADNTLNQIIYTYDRAPNSGNGKDYVTVGSGPVGGSYALRVEPPSAEVVRGQNTTVQVLLSNLGSADGNVTLSTPNLTEGLSATFDTDTVRIAAGANVTANLTISATQDAPSSANITLVATDASGASANASLLLTIIDPPTLPTETSAANATGNETGTAAGGDNETPGLQFVSVLVATVALALWRRRS